MTRQKRQSAAERRKWRLFGKFIQEARATFASITAYLKNNGALETAQQIANHESPRTAKLYDRRQDEISLDEVERMAI